MYALSQGLFTYDIRAIRILAFQRELLVVRTHRNDPSMPLALELYQIPHDNSPSQPDSAPAAWPRSVHTIAIHRHVLATRLEVPRDILRCIQHITSLGLTWGELESDKVAYF